MRRTLPLLCLVFACTAVFAQKDCRYAEYSENAFTVNPELRKKAVAIDEFIHNHTGDRRVALSDVNATAASLPSVITIPVVVHIVYNNDAQNLSDAQVLSQIEVLNKDFRNLNTDRLNVPDYFKKYVADCGIEFRLARQDPQGAPTTGIVRKKTSIMNFGMDDRVKYTARGGDDAWDAGRYLNLWVCNLTGGVVGYASLVGCTPEADGVVISSMAFGISPGNNASYNKGRTATHEIGHWLNLRHIWGDVYCGDDKVDDTPTQRSPNRGCPSGKNLSCGTTENGDMYMNFMDLTNDACMNMFTLGQRERMRALFINGGPRASLLSSNALVASPGTEAPLPSAGDQLQPSEAAITLFPNPASTILTVQTAGECGFVIYNSMGQALRRYSLTPKQRTIDISALKNGVYYLKPLDGQKGGMIKFIKAG